MSCTPHPLATIHAKRNSKESLFLFFILKILNVSGILSQGILNKILQSLNWTIKKEKKENSQHKSCKDDPVLLWHVCLFVCWPSKQLGLSTGNSIELLYWFLLKFNKGPFLGTNKAAVAQQSIQHWASWLQQLATGSWG